MSRTLHLIIIALQMVLFVVPLGAVAYFSETQQWERFWLLVVICSLLFVALQLSQSRDALGLLRRLQQREFRLHQRFDKYGIEDIFNMQDTQEMNERNAETANIINRGNRFSLLSLSAASYIDAGVKRHWDYLKPKLEAGAPLRLLILNPFCAEREMRDRLNSVSTQYDSKLRLDLVLALYNRYENVSVRFTSKNIYCALFFTENEMLYDPYHLGKVEDRIENYFIALKLANKDVTLRGHCYYKILIRHFEYLWDTADDIETFLIKYNQQLKSTPISEIAVKSRYALTSKN